MNGFTGLMRKAGSACVAEPVLRWLVPGTLCDRRVFEPMCAHWPADRQVHVADLHHLDEPHVWCKEQLQSMPAQVDLLGFSLGGILAMQLLAMAPERVRRLVLVASNPQPGTPAHAQRVREQMALWQQKGPHALAKDMLDQATAPARQTPELLRTVQAMAEATPFGAFEAQGRLNASRPDGGPVLARWRGPLLLISGASDPWCGADKQALCKQSRPDALWRELPEAGHYLPLENPAWLASTTDEFLN